MFGLVTHESIRQILCSLNEHNPRLGLKVFLQYEVSELSYVLTYTNKQGEEMDITRRISPNQLYSFLMHIWIQGYKSGYITRKQEPITI